MSSKPITILVCDDEPIILEIVEYVVSGENFNLITADNGKDALRLAREAMPDLIMLDDNMPELTGFEVCKILKNDDQTKDITVVMFTANTQASDYEKAKLYGANDFIKKPFSPKELKLKLYELLG